VKNENTESDAEKDWVYRDSTKRLLWRLLLGACALALLLELFVLGDRRAGAHFGFDRWFGFFAAFGFVTCTLMVFLAKALGNILKVPTDFYDGDDKEGGAK